MCGTQSLPRLPDGYVNIRASSWLSCPAVGMQPGSVSMEAVSFSLHELSLSPDTYVKKSSCSSSHIVGCELRFVLAWVLDFHIVLSRNLMLVPFQQVT